MGEGVQLRNPGARSKHNMENSFFKLPFTRSLRREKRRSELVQYLLLHQILLNRREEKQGSSVSTGGTRRDEEDDGKGISDTNPF